MHLVSWIARNKSRRNFSNAHLLQLNNGEEMRLYAYILRQAKYDRRIKQECKGACNNGFSVHFNLRT